MDTVLALWKQPGPAFRFVEFSVLVAFESNHCLEWLLPERNDQPLAFIPFHSANRVVVGFGVYGPQDGVLTRGYPDHAAVPLGGLFWSGADLSFDISKQVVVFALQAFVISRLSTEIKDQLKGAYERDRGAQPMRIRTEALERQKVTKSSGAEKDNQEVKEPVDAFQRPSTSNMVERVSEHVEAYQLKVLFHFSFLCCGGGAGCVGAAGCLGPTLVPGLGCRGPIEWIPKSPLGLSTMSDVITLVSVLFSDIGVVSDWLVQLGSVEVDGCSSTRRPRNDTTKCIRESNNAEMLGVCI